MVSTFTTNIQLEEPARGDQVGTWDTPVNNNSTLLDLTIGQFTALSIASGNVTLSAGQYKSATLLFNSTMIQNTTITFPTSFTKPYNIINNATGSSAFTLIFATTAGGQVICAPPGATFQCMNDGTNMRFLNFGGPIGSYFDYAGSSNPTWNSCSSVPPYIVCDGTTFNGGLYPALQAILGGTTAPDGRGRLRASLNQGTGRMTSGNGGVDGNTNLAAGGNDTQTLTVGQIPTGLTGNNSASFNVTATQNSGTFTPVFNADPTGAVAAGGINVQGGNPNNLSATKVQTTGTVGAGGVLIQITNAGGGSHPIMQPTLIGGIMMIRAG